MIEHVIKRFVRSSSHRCSAKLTQMLIVLFKMRELQSIFENDFKFVVSITQLDFIGTEPQIQLDTAIADFVRKHDRIEKGRLLIVYYSGHGSTSTTLPVQLIIAGPYDKQRHANCAIDDQVHFPQANFSQAARILHENTASDVLVIIDSCHAGAFVTDSNNSIEDTRRYEVMVATGSEGTTAASGPGTYTAALIESLKECCNSGKVVTTMKLAQMITEKQGQREESQSSLHSLLLGRDGGHIVLAPFVKEKRVCEGGDCTRLGPDLYREGQHSTSKGLSPAPIIILCTLCCAIYPALSLPLEE